MALCLVIGACSEELGEPATDVVARWHGGELTTDELRAALAHLPASRRPPVEEGVVTAEWREELVRELVVDRLLADGEDDLGPSARGALEARLQEEERLAAWEEMVARALGSFQPPTRAEAEGAYDRWLREAARPERRRVGNIFLQARPDETRDALRGRAQALAARVGAGEAFADLARTHSDSESRHRGGSIGTLAAEDLPPPVRAVVFSLEEHAISEPLVNRDGAHLFYVEAIEPASGGSVEEVAPAVEAWLREEREREAIEAFVAELPDPAVPSVVVSRAELEAIVQERRFEDTVLQRGDYRLALSDLTTAEERLGLEALVARLQRLVVREKVHAHAVADGWLELPHLRPELERARAAHVGELLRRDGVRRFAAADVARLESYFERNRARFSGPLRLRVEIWRLPLEEGSSKELILDLERRHRRPAGEGPELARIRELYGGRVEDLGWVSVEDLARRAPTGLLAALEVGATSPPYRSMGGVEILRVLDRREPEIPPLDAVRDDVIDALLDDEGQRLYHEWRDSILSGAGFEVFVDRLGVAR